MSGEALSSNLSVTHTQRQAQENQVISKAQGPSGTVLFQTQVWLILQLPFPPTLA
jgi:hypothetical protein